MVNAILSDLVNVILIHDNNQEAKQRFGMYSLNDDYLELLRELRLSSKTYIFTASTLLSHEKISNSLEEFFDDMFDAKTIGFNKYDERAYQKISELIKLPFSEILFIDDNIENVEVAKSLGMQGFHFKSNEEFKGFLKEMGLLQ